MIDERLSRDRRGILTRLIASVRHFATIQILHGEVDETTLLQKIQAEPFQLVLAPWYHYLSWSKTEAHYGRTRTSGPTFAGYFCEPIPPLQLGSQADHLRAILLDFTHLQPSESCKLIRSLLHDSLRTGITPLLDSNASVYCENWMNHQGQGLRVDQILKLPEISQFEWTARAPAIRVVLSALWGLIYEEGPGKSEFAQAISGGTRPRAYFEIGCDAHTLVFRLWYSMPGWGPKNALTQFWPNPEKPTAAPQFLLKFADFLRVHTIEGTGDVEVVVGLFASRPSEKAHSQIHSLWIEPIASHLISEIPFEGPNPRQPWLKALPGIPAGAQQAGSKKEQGQDLLQAKDRFIAEATQKIRKLQREIEQRDELIRDLKTGGVGTAKVLPIPDPESLLEAFQERYFEAEMQLKQFEMRIAEIEQKGASATEIQALQEKMATLSARQQGWIRQLASTLHIPRKIRKTGG